MRNTLKSLSWKETSEKIRKCHLSCIGEELSIKEWDDAFNALINSIIYERTYNATFATELYYLSIDTGFTYDIKDVLEEYFDHLESKEAWESVIRSSKIILNTFAWNNFKPSEYKYRIGNALLKEGKLKEAEVFGKKWLEEDPSDLYAAASNSFLQMALGNKEEAKNIASKFLDPNLVCSEDTQTVFLAALSLYDMTDDKYAKRRIEEKIAEFNNLVDHN